MGRWVAAVAVATWLIVPGQVRAEEFQDDENGWGIVEHEWIVAPVEAPQPTEVLEGNLPKRPGPAWPSDELLRKWDYGDSFAFPRLTPDVGADIRTVVGDVSDGTNFISRLRAELYLLEVGVNVLESVDGDRRTDVEADVDLRIPFSFGSSVRLALMPGASVPIDGRSWNSRNTNVRTQAIAGYGAGGVGLQLRLGITDGPRAAGLLDVGDRFRHTAALYGGLVAWRVVPFLQLRAEVAGEVATEDGAPDRLSLLPGVVFFPWSDPRLQIGLTAIVEDSRGDVDFEDVSWGGLMNLGITFL